MGVMSASDAAPLPRLGEVFFDVRGDSRSMRLSWYADTGVAVLSIWQGGMCTGTFRLAIGDLPRMVETLQRGPAGQRQERDGAAPGPQSAEHHSVPPAQQPVPPRHLAELPGDPGATQYLGEPARQGGPRTSPPGYLPDLPDLPGRPAAAPDPGIRLPDYLTGSFDYHAAPPDHRTEYLADVPGYMADVPGPAQMPDGYGDAFHTGSRSAAYQDRGEAHSPAGGAAGYLGDPYLARTGPMDYRGEPSASHYPSEPSLAGHGDPPARSAADYPAYYGSTVTDDIADEPSGDSFPYGRPPVGRRARNRHAAPDVPFD